MPEAPGTSVRLCSQQVPASGPRGLVVRAFGRREVARSLRDSLEKLAALTS